MCHRNSSKRGGHSNTHGNHTCTTTDNVGISPINNNTNTNKWVINISGKPLTEAQEKLLAHGPNYAVVPRSPSITEYVVAIEQVCNKLQQGKAEELRGESNPSLRKHTAPQHHQGRNEGRKRIEESYFQNGPNSRQGGVTSCYGHSRIQEESRRTTTTANIPTNSN